MRSAIHSLRFTTKIERDAKIQPQTPRGRAAGPLRNTAGPQHCAPLQRCIQPLALRLTIRLLLRRCDPPRSRRQAVHALAQRPSQPQRLQPQPQGQQRLRILALGALAQRLDVDVFRPRLRKRRIRRRRSVVVAEEGLSRFASSFAFSFFFSPSSLLLLSLFASPPSLPPSLSRSLRFTFQSGRQFQMSFSSSSRESFSATPGSSLLCASRTSSVGVGQRLPVDAAARRVERSGW
jgi:hypothetical protein